MINREEIVEIAKSVFMIEESDVALKSLCESLVDRIIDKVGGEWVSVEDRLPEVDRMVLAFRNSSNPEIVIQYIKWWKGDQEEWSHWKYVQQPTETSERSELPQPPKSEEGE